MNNIVVLIATIICSAILEVESKKVLQQYFRRATDCEKYCAQTYKKENEEVACEKGCRLLTIIELAKDLEKNSTKAQQLCFSGCKEAYGMTLENSACGDGCIKESKSTVPKEEETQTLHLLTPLMYVKSAYKTAINQIKQLMTTSFTLYVEEDTGKMVMLQSKPKAIMELSEGHNSDGKIQERRTWVDCISQQSGLPRWILISVLFGFIITLMWLCCVTTVTAPHQHLSSNTKKIIPKNDVAYLYLYEPIDEVKIQPPAYEEAPPLPAKETLA